MRHKEKDYQKNRLLLQDSALFSCLHLKHPKSKVYIGNFGYIVVPTDVSLPVTKYYIENKFYIRERSNYSLFMKSGINIPDIYNIGIFEISGVKIKFIEFENVRKKSQRYEGYNEISTSGLASILSRIHSINNNKSVGMTHGNPHFSNFYSSSETKLGVFDLVSAGSNFIEYDFGSIFFHSGYDIEFLEKLIGYHVFSSSIIRKRIYYYTMKKIIKNIKLNNALDSRAKNKLKCDLEKITFLYSNIK